MEIAHLSDRIYIKIQRSYTNWNLLYFYSSWNAESRIRSIKGFHFRLNESFNKTTVRVFFVQLCSYISFYRITFSSSIIFSKIVLLRHFSRPSWLSDCLPLFLCLPLCFYLIILCVCKPVYISLCLYQSVCTYVCFYIYVFMYICMYVCM